MVGEKVVDDNGEGQVDEVYEEVVVVVDVDVVVDLWVVMVVFGNIVLVFMVVFVV